MAELTGPPSISLITLVELQGGLASKSAGKLRRERLAVMLRAVDVVGFDRPVVEIYGDMFRTLGFSRSRVLDRLIAATAIVHNLTLVTINGKDFRDIPGLKLEVWPALVQ